MKKLIRLFRIILSVGIINIFCAGIFAQEVSQNQIIRFSLWALTDAFPGDFPVDSESQTQAVAESEKQKEEDFNIFKIPVSQIKKTAPFIVQGMAYGWKFDYTPSDKARKVAEYFEFTPIKELTESEKKSIVYAKPWIKESRLWCWIEYPRTVPMQRYLESWKTINHPHIMGTGYGKLTDGFDGIQNACKEALKNAVRQYERKIIKNKPKEILGTVILNGPPSVGTDAGRYVVTLDFFMETDRIIEYKKF